MNRFGDDSGWSITGALATLGSACAWVSRSATTWRALKMSVPGSKIITIEDRPASDSERISSRNATPCSRSASSGHRDELLDLFGREAEGLGLDLDIGRRELGQHIDAAHVCSWVAPIAAGPRRCRCR